MCTQAALNLSSDAKVIKTAGAILTHPFGGIMRSIIVAIFALGADEVFVVGHSDCGMSTIDPAATIEKMHAQGISRETVSTLESAGISIRHWLEDFSDVDQCVTSSCTMIRRHPLLPRHVPVHGLVIDPASGALRLVIDGNKPAAAEARGGDSGGAGTAAAGDEDAAAGSVALTSPSFRRTRFSDVTAASITLTGRSGETAEV